MVIYGNYFQLIDCINNKNYSFKPSIKIRILNYFVNFVTEYQILPLFCHINDSEEDNYFKFALQLQNDIINHMNEDSILFMLLFISTWIF